MVIRRFFIEEDTACGLSALNVKKQKKLKELLDDLQSLKSSYRAGRVTSPMSNKNCHAVHWDKVQVVKVKMPNKTSIKEASPTWVQNLLSELGFRISSDGESYVYTIRLKKNIPDRVSEEFCSKQPNKAMIVLCWNDVDYIPMHVI